MAAAGVSRITIAAPRSQVDLAVPTNLPLASLLATLLRYAGDDLADSGATQGGWVLSRLGGPPMDTSRTLGEHQIRDGEVLYLTSRASAPPEAVVDDVADAVAAAIEQRRGEWSLAATRRASMAVGGAALVGGAAALLFVGPPHLMAGAAALGIAALLVVTATVLARALLARTAGAVFSMVALAYAAVGGLLLLGGDRPVGQLEAAHLLLSATAITVTAAILTVAAGNVTPLLPGAAAGGLVLGLGAGLSLTFDIPAASSAAVIAVIGLGLLPVLPTIAARLARVPAPEVPTSADDLRADTKLLDAAELRRRAHRADALLGATVAATAAILNVVAGVLVFGDATLPLAAVIAAVLFLQARSFVRPVARVALLAGGTASIGLVAVGVFARAHTIVGALVVIGGLGVVALVALSYGLAVAGRRIAPVWGRFLDILEAMLIVGAVPLAAWASGLYGWIRGLSG